MSVFLFSAFAAAWLACFAAAAEPFPTRDTRADTWTATDALGRTLPGHPETGPVRADKYAGVFYFLWMGQHGTGGPYDVSKILAAHPDAMSRPGLPAWGPPHHYHHWGEPLFGYYLSDDAWVIRKHAQMLSDAGVDVIIFDVSNQVTYRTCYERLCEVFMEVRRDGGKTPQIAFLCPFWDPAAVVRRLYEDLYRPGRFPDLWFRWKGRPLILADPALPGGGIRFRPNEMPAWLAPHATLGQSFTAKRPFDRVSACFPTDRTTNAAVRLTLFRDGPAGERIAGRMFRDVEDNGWLNLDTGESQPPGCYYLEASDAAGRIGWWSSAGDKLAGGTAFAAGVPAAGDRSLEVNAADEETIRLREFFTFRKPQPDYFAGPTGPDQWGWLEIHPQHVFTNAQGRAEQMTVGVAQNAAGRRLCAFSEAGVRGRSWHGGKKDTSPGAVLHGLNFAEQARRALDADPEFVFVTGWNEWIAMRLSEFNGVREPVMLVDQFTQEYSRDIEPMAGGHGDNYYYQMTAFIRRFKGVREPLPPGVSRNIKVDGRFDDWRDVSPEYLDDAGDIMCRDHPGYDGAGRYVNRSGRNDFVSLKMTANERQAAFYARTRHPVTSREGDNWMLLFIDADNDPRTGWEGFDLLVNRRADGTDHCSVEKNTGGWNWTPSGKARLRVSGCELELAVPRRLLAGAGGVPDARFSFKWADNIQRPGDILDFLVNGDTAPNGRFQYPAGCGKKAPGK